MGNAIYRFDGTNWLRVPNIRHLIGYQQWTGYPQSPVLTADYPYQALGTEGYPDTNLVVLILSENKLSLNLNLFGCDSIWFVGAYRAYTLSGGVWVLESFGGSGNSGSTPLMDNIQCNYDIYTDITYTTVYIAKTTTPAQDAAWLRDRAVRYKTSLGEWNRVNI